MSTLRCLALGCIAAASLAGAGPGAAAAEANGSSYQDELWNGLMSPYCPGRSLIDCPSEQAAELRDWIAQQEAAGRSREDVEQEIYERFGDVVLQAPKASGFGLAAYVIPIALFLAGGAGVWLFLKRQALAAAPRAALPASPALDPEVERRIDEELRG